MQRFYAIVPDSWEFLGGFYIFIGNYPDLETAKICWQDWEVVPEHNEE